MKKQLIIAAVAVFSSLSMQGMQVLSKVKTARRTTSQARKFSSPAHPKKQPQYYIDDLVKKATSIESAHGSAAYFLRDIPLLEFDSPNQGMSYFSFVDICLTEGINTPTPEEFISMINQIKQQQKK